MTKPQKQTVTFEELALSNMYQLEAMARVLEKKGICSRKEILEELKVIKKEEAERKRKIGE